MRNKYNIDLFIKKSILEMFKLEYSYDRIALELGVSIRTFWRYCKNFKIKRKCKI